jgi:hypothetical protein
VRRATLALLALACALLVFPLSSFALATVTYTWSGSWARGAEGPKGDLILVQTGDSVTGHYTWNDATGVVNGKVSGTEGTTFTGAFNETNYEGTFELRLDAPYYRSFTGSYTGKNKNTDQPISGPFTGTCFEGDCLGNSSGLKEVRVVATEPDCQFHKGGSPADAWYPIEKNTVLKGGDEITCDPDGSVTMAFADNSTVTVRNTTQLKIASFFTDGGVVRTEILLKMGEVAAQVNKSEATKSDFRIKSPTAVSSVRGTIFSVFADPVGGASITSVQRGVVEVDPTKPGLPTVEVPVGKQVEVTAATESPIAPIGKAGAIGGVNREQALALVDKLLRRFGRPCSFTPSHTGASLGAKPSGSGWLVSVLVAGGVQGWSAWQVVGSKVTPANALAKTIAGGCKGARPAPGAAGASVTFTHAGSPLGSAIAAPQTANDLEVNLDPHTGVIANGHWTKDGKSLGPVTVPSGADGLVFAAAPGAGPGTPVARPPGATGFHVFWNATGVLTSAVWTRVGKTLATIPLTAGQKAIAIANASG